MKELLEYINSLSTKEQADFAAKCKTTIGYLRKAISVDSKLSTDLCVRIEVESLGVVTRKHLYPNDWASHWPELDEKKAA